MEVKFTDEQQAVIDARDCNILVSAAAGSGKTAVLVERIIRMISTDIDVDHLLVVTFTKAAASQMKEKITEAIQKELMKSPDNAHLQRQETLIHSAQITTIDSFCQYIIRNNFNTIGLDPSFRVGDDGELKLLQEEVMSELLEEEYAASDGNPDSDFLFCMDYFATGSKDSRVEEYINQLFKFSMSMPWPEDWLRDRAGDYEIGDSSFDELPWVKECIKQTKRVLQETIDKYDGMIRVSLESDGPYMYEQLLQDEKASICAGFRYDTYDALFDGIRGISFGRLSSKKDPSVDADKRDYIKNIRDSVKEDVKGLIENYFALTSGTIVTQMKLCDRAVKELCRLTLEFKSRFDQKKREKQLIDFSDMEHFALDILVNHPAPSECEGLNALQIMEKCTPSVVALEYREFFKEVLIDEYQDSNNVQEMILGAIAGEKSGISERFMVGDVKQSIYKFRLARPEIFMEKLGSFDKDPAALDRRIDLHKNFRSRPMVLEGTNYIFRKIMGDDLGGVDYDDDAILVPGASFDEPAYDITPELIMIDGSDVIDASQPDEMVGNLSPREKEALAVAERIHQLRRENPSLNYKDIVILLRSLSGWDDVFMDVLRSQGIPVYTESKSGYFEAPEVSVLLDLLSVIDNPRQDIPLVSVMHSEIGGFSDEDLARIRVAIDSLEDTSLSGSFHEGMELLCGLQDESFELLPRVSQFLNMIEEFRTLSTYTPVHELVQLIIDRTDFESIMTAQPAGNQRRANIELLLTNAANFEKTSFKGLFHFVRYIEHLKNVQVDYGEAGLIDENADVVRIMSIHKSKGLEFPVVFVSGLSKEFNRMDTRGDLIADMDLGIGVKCINSELRVKYDTLKRQIIADKMNLDSLGEEIRVLYVALTRAKEKLILTSYEKDLGKELSNALMELPLLESNQRLLPYSVRTGAKSYFDLILPSLIMHPQIRATLEGYQLPMEQYDDGMDKGSVPAIKFMAVGESYLKENMVGNALGAALRKQELREVLENALFEGDETGLIDKELCDRLREKFDFEYPYSALKGLFTKTSVSELKKLSYHEESEVCAYTAEFADIYDEVDGGESFTVDETSAEGYIGELVQEQAGTSDAGRLHRLTGAERGTAYHRIMELLDENIYGNVELMEKAAAEAGYRGNISNADDMRGDDEESSTGAGLRYNISNADDMRGDDEESSIGAGLRYNISNADNVRTSRMGEAAKAVYIWGKKKAAEGWLSDDEQACVYSPDVVKFLGSDLGQRMGEAFRRGELYREKPFMMGVPASELNSQFPDEEMVLVQGIIDAWFIEDGELVLMDYKTDRIKEEKTLIDRYRVQLDLYKRALEAATMRKVKEVYIYSFCLGKVIDLPVT